MFCNLVLQDYLRKEFCFVLIYFPLLQKICDVSFDQNCVSVWDSCSTDTLEIFWFSYSRECMVWFSWIPGWRDGSPHATLFWSGTGDITIEFQSLPLLLLFGREPDWSLEPFLLWSFIPCSSHRSRNPEWLCLLWTEGPEGCSLSPFLTLLLFYFSTKTFMVGLRPAMCFISQTLTLALSLSDTPPLSSWYLILLIFLISPCTEHNIECGKE